MHRALDMLWSRTVGIASPPRSDAAILRAAIKHNGASIREGHLDAALGHALLELGALRIQEEAGLEPDGRLTPATVERVTARAPDTDLPLGSYERVALWAETDGLPAQGYNLRRLGAGEVALLQVATALALGTETAQDLLGLLVDGKAGPRTRAALQAVLDGRLPGGEALAIDTDWKAAPPVERPRLGPVPRGKGFFVSALRACGPPERVERRARELELAWVAVLRDFQRSRQPTQHFNDDPDERRPYLEAFRNAGCDLWIWGWPVPAQQERFIERTVQAVLEDGALGLILDVEADYAGEDRAAAELVHGAMEAAHPHDLPVGVTSYGGPWFHGTMPWWQLAHGDFGIPQVYDIRNSLGPDYPERAVEAWCGMGNWDVIPAITTYNKSSRQLTELLERLPVPASGLATWQWRTTRGRMWKLLAEIAV